MVNVKEYAVSASSQAVKIKLTQVFEILRTNCSDEGASPQQLAGQASAGLNAALSEYARIKTLLTGTVVDPAKVLSAEKAMIQATLDSIVKDAVEAALVLHGSDASLVKALASIDKANKCFCSLL